MQQFLNQPSIIPEVEGTEFERILNALSTCLNKYSETIYGIEGKVNALKSPISIKKDDMPHPLRSPSSSSDDTVTSVLRSEMERFFELNEIAFQVFCRLNDIV